MTDMPKTVEELESQAVSRLNSIGKQLWAMISLIVLVTVGATTWMTRTDMRLEGVEQAVTLLSTGAIVDLRTRLRLAETELTALRSDLRALDRRTEANERVHESPK